MDAELQALYDRIPAIPGCDGRCWTSCGPIGMSDRERQRIRGAGYRITPYDQALRSADTYWCEALTGDRRCAVYDILRPIVCRLWGAVAGLPCIYGCVPEGGYLSDAEGYRLISESMRIGGGELAVPGPVEEITEVIARDNIRAELQQVRDRGIRGKRAGAAGAVPVAFRRPELATGPVSSPAWPG